MHELRRYRKSLVIWTMSLVLLAIVFLSIYPSLIQGGDLSLLQEIMNSFDEAYKQLFSLDDNVFTSLVGFYGFLLTFVLLIGAIQATNLGLSLLSQEDRNKTADFLLSKPVTRSDVITSKLMAGITVLVITNAIFIPTMITITNNAFEEKIASDVLLLATLSLFFVQMFFLSLGLMLSVSFRKIKSVVSVSLPTVFGFYLIGILDGVIDEQTIRYLSPFKYFKISYINEYSMYEGSYLLVGIIVMLIAIVLTYKIYTRKDIHGV